MRAMTGLLPAVICFLGCGTGHKDCVRGTGEVMAREIPVAMLNAIIVTGSTDVTIVRGDTQRVEVIAQPELIGLVKTKVDNGVWEITTTECYSSDREFSVRLTVPMLNSVIVRGSGDVRSEEVFNTGKTHLEVSGSGNIAVDTLHEGLLEIRNAGSGDILIGGGECRRMDVRLSGSGSVQAGELCAANTKADLSGTGGLVIDVLDSLTADLSGSGDLRYRGSPIVISNTVSSGKLIAMP